MDEYKAYLAEFISTFALIFIGAGAILAGSNVLGVGVAHGLVLMAMIYATAHISGAHVNPAVTIAMMATKNIDIARGSFYIMFQLLGAVFAAFMLSIIFTNAPASLDLGATKLAEGVDFFQGTLLEAILTFFLVFTIFGVAVDKKAPQGMYGLAIGIVLTFDIIVGGALTGASMNPARSFGPAAVSGFWTDHLVYWVGPVFGALVAALVYSNVLMEKKEGKK
ncbi:MAG TPA: aquaporin [Candidatus Bilamarchaeaceae archaeon]|nr:aquaporin [Candidatus Bilamarchaeaceae archaeon]